MTQTLSVSQQIARDFINEQMKTSGPLIASILNSFFSSDLEKVEHDPGMDHIEFTTEMTVEEVADFFDCEEDAIYFGSTSVNDDENEDE